MKEGLSRHNFKDYEEKLIELITYELTNSELLHNKNIHK